MVRAVYEMVGRVRLWVGYLDSLIYARLYQSSNLFHTLLRFLVAFIVPSNGEQRQSRYVLLHIVDLLLLCRLLLQEPFLSFLCGAICCGGCLALEG